MQSITSRLRWFCFVLLFTVGALVHGQEVDIQTYTNGVDADTPPGPTITVGATVTWTYVVSNISGRELTSIQVTDDQGVIVTCPATVLDAGFAMTCTASGVATVGQYSNIGTVNALQPDQSPSTASDPSHYLGVLPPTDFGDAVDPTYPTLTASNGARHVLGSAVYLGACVDAEADGLSSASADGDDTNIGTTTFGTCAVAGDDEDGVTFSAVLPTGGNGGVDVVASAPCTLSAWIDFNADGDWSDAGESLFPSGTALIAGANALSFSIPANAATGTTRSRFRCTTDGVTAPTGQASNGEVEDHPVTLVAGTVVISATKVDALLVDVDSDTNAEPGDTLRYTIVVRNDGNLAATSVIFSDSPDTNTTLVTGSVTTSVGTVVTGNTAGDTSVGVNVGTLSAAGGSVTITFDVTIDNDLAAGVNTVANQGSVSGANFTSIVTDDPSVGGTTDATITPLTVAPIVSATKTVVITTDRGVAGSANPGDVLRYTIVVTNSGNAPATGLVFNDTPDANTTLVNGSVSTTTGSVALGNTSGDASVTVNIGTLAAGASATIVFDVTVDTLASNVTQIVNSGTVTGTGITTVTTDDPSRPGSSDSTTVAAATTPPAPAVPTADVWALLAMTALLGILALRRL